MPEKRNVIIGFRSWQDGEPTRAELRGELFRLRDGWAVAYREGPDENGTETSNTLFVRDSEIRLRRRGTILFEQVFRKGERLPGTVETPYGRHGVLASTTSLDSGLSEAGGHIDWTYDLLMQDQKAGSFRIRLDIREE